MKKKIPPDLIQLLEKYGIETPQVDKEYTYEELNQLIDRVDRLIEQKKKGRLEIPNQGNRRFLTNVMQVVLIGFASAATALADKGLGSLPPKEEKEKKHAQKFTFDVVVHMIIGTDILSTLFNAIAKKADTNEKNQGIIAEALKVLTFLIAIHVATKGNEDRMATLFDAFSEKIEKSLDLLGSYLNDKIITDNIPKGTTEQLSLKLQQAKLALQKGEVNKFINVCKGALGLLDMSPDLLEKNIKEIEFFVKTLTEALSSKEENSTAIAQAM